MGGQGESTQCPRGQRVRQQPVEPRAKRCPTDAEVPHALRSRARRGAVIVFHHSPGDKRLHGAEASVPLSEWDTCSQNRKTVRSVPFHVRG
ncbi:hypothetical protein RHA1_ro08292 (plasmid) [Rhodococcus jostii RHA1]|uniref:Uncharacterized protein n=1 Tax=Rhodococcus jostii (strain RHA1) TaxID=101510 RepID=Q0RZF0_RHOJR|nr:hypothetical protein RHA1_ro08292 [Rhodococcus jostii RHA1]